MKLMKIFKNGGMKNVVKSVGMKISQVSPEIMLVSGIFSVLGGTVYACMKTEQAKKLAAETKEELIQAKQALETPEGADILPETVKQLKIERGRQYVKIYSKAAWGYTKLYGPPALLWFGGMGLITCGHAKLRSLNRMLAADILTGNQLLQEYRERVGRAVGKEVEEKIFLGADEGMVSVLETDEETGEEKLVEKPADIFNAQPGSIFAMNFTERNTTEAFKNHTFAEDWFDRHVAMVNTHLEAEAVCGYTGLDILRMLDFTEDAIRENEERVNRLLRYGISTNAMKVPDPEMRKLKVTKLRGYEERWDPERGMNVFTPCLRVDFNFYPLEGML